MIKMLADLYEDPLNFTRVSSPDLFDIDYDQIAKLQLHHFKRRFALMRDRVPALTRLADDVEIDAIGSFDDLASLAFPHTTYKSYSAADLDNGRYDRMTRWLQSLTTHNLSHVDVEGCESIDDWLDRIEAQTPLRPSLSSGTSGKISVWPRSTVEEPFFLEFIHRMFDPYPGENTLNLREGKVPYLCAWPASTGRHSMTIIMRLLRAGQYKGREDQIIVLNDGHMSAGALWLAGKLRRAETLGEKLELTPREKALATQMAAEARDMEKCWDRFIERAVVQQRGKQVLYFGFWIHTYQLAKACADRGMRIEWAPDSIVLTGGGTKGFNFPDNFMDVINDVYPWRYPDHFRESYGMTETTAVSSRCVEGNLHPLPWGIQHVVDPDTSKPLPRRGTQRGRLLTFDLLPTTQWTGTATGDEVSVHWEGGCACGRKGLYIDNDIRRLADSRGGDDKITCAKTPQAYERLEEFLAT